MPESSLEVSIRIGPIEFLIQAADFSDCLAELQSDFQEFALAADWGLTHWPHPQRESIELSALTTKNPAPGARWKFAEGHFSGAGAHRRVVYEDGSWVRADRNSRKSQVFAKNRERAYEITYLLMNSRLGEALDRAGYHRVHGLGLRYPETSGAWLMLMDSGVGKSRLALGLAGKVEFYSDESPVISNDGAVLPFPIRLAIASSLLRRGGFEPEGRRRFTRLRYGTKCLVPLSELGKIAGRDLPKVLATVKKSTDGRPHWREASSVELKWALFRGGVIGIGIAQMKEHLLRWDWVGLAQLVRMALSRRKAMRALLSKEPVLLAMEFSDDVSANIRMLGEAKKWIG